MLAVADTLKDDAVVAVRELKALRLETVMLTGDNRRTAEAIARQVGVVHVLAEIAMAISSVTGVTNANLLRRVDIQPEVGRG